MDPLIDGFANWHLSPKFSEALDIVAPSMQEDREGLEITLDQEDVGVTLKILMEAGMLLYFTENPPSLISIRNWETAEFIEKQGWPLLQIKILGNHFFLICFTDPTHRKEALVATPWFMFRQYVYTMAWDPSFDVQRDLQTRAPIWIELPYRALILEHSQKSIVATLEPILHFAHSEDDSSYPHDQACIL